MHLGWHLKVSEIFFIFGLVRTTVTQLVCSVMKLIRFKDIRGARLPKGPKGWEMASFALSVD